MSPDSPADSDEKKPTASKSLPNGTASSTSTPITATSSKPGVKLLPRVDVENIYLQLRESLGNDWGGYSDAVRSFFRGLTNRTELATIVDPFLTTTTLQRLHNQYFFAVEVNATREPPEADVATWVSHAGKISSSSGSGALKSSGGDAHERRLKKEIMSIPARDRRRMKEIPEPTEELNNTLARTYTAKQIKNFDTLGMVSAGGARSAGLNKNWQTEVSNAYQASLAVESGEYIDIDAIQTRCIPICFEENISSAVSEETARFIALATDFFVKDILTTMMDRVRLDESKRVLEDITDDSIYPTVAVNGTAVEKKAVNGINGHHTSQTRKKKKMVEKRKAAILEKRGGTITMEHLRLSISLSDNLVRQMPLSVYSILGGVNQYDRYEDEEQEEEEEEEPEGPQEDGHAVVNGRSGKRLKMEKVDEDAEGNVPDTAAASMGWENPASRYLMQCLSGH